MAFTLISISRLDQPDQAGYSIIFNKNLCTIKNSNGNVIAMIPHSNGLYKVVGTKGTNVNETASVASAKISISEAVARTKGTNVNETASVTSAKMSISEAHRKFRHIAHSAVKHAISSGSILGVELDLDSKVGFCEACAKAKLIRQPFPKESETRAEIFGERVHWDLWDQLQSKA
jgi:hypothetical protein